MIHINSRTGHEMLTQEEFNERHPALAAALNAPTPYKEYGEKMARIRKSAGMTIRELAKAMGMRMGDVSGIETGRIQPTGDQVDLYQIKVNEYRSKNPNRQGGPCICHQGKPA